MATYFPFAFNDSGSLIPDTQQVDTLVLTSSSSSEDWSQNPGGVKYWMSPDTDNVYLLTKTNPKGNQPTNTPEGNIGTVGFESCARNDTAWLEMINGLPSRVGKEDFTDPLLALHHVLSLGYFENYTTRNSSTFQIMVNSEENGVTNNDQFQIKVGNGNFDYDISTNDGYTATGVTGDHTITFPSGPGVYLVFITGDFPTFKYGPSTDAEKLFAIINYGIYSANNSRQKNANESCANLVIGAGDLRWGRGIGTGELMAVWKDCSSLIFFPPLLLGGATSAAVSWQGCSSLRTFPLVDTNRISNLQQTWQDCSSLEEFPLLDTSNVTKFDKAWSGCISLESFPDIDTKEGRSFKTTWFRCERIEEFPLINTSNATNITSAWRSCSSLTSFPLIDTSKVTNIARTWANCTSLTSFPLVDTSIVTTAQQAWSNCSSLTSFPVLLTGNISNFRQAWSDCASLTSFPVLNTQNGSNFFRTWRDCESLTTFPSLNFDNGTNFQEAWRECTVLTNFPQDLFDNCTATNFRNAFLGTNLNSASIDNILISLDIAGQSNGIFTQSGGSVASTAGQTSATTLRNRGWTVALTS